MAAAEQVVRDYMRFIRDPDAFKSDTAELDDRIKATDDPLQRLRLQQERVAASNPGTQLEEAFITHAKAYADEAGVDGRAFMAEGVSANVLTKAGLLSGRGRRPGGGGSRTRRSKRVGTEDIRKAVKSRRKNSQFTIRDIQDGTEGSAATVRKVIADMVASGELIEVGRDPGHSGPGRSPTLYKKS